MSGKVYYNIEQLRSLFIISILLIILKLNFNKIIINFEFLEASLLCCMTFSKKNYFQLFTHLSSKNDINYIKRTMFKSKEGASLTSRLCKSLFVTVPKASMSAYTLNSKEKNPKDASANVKNPIIVKGKKKIQHPEIRRKRCTDTDCDQKTCPPNQPCGAFKDYKIIGNTTHGTKDTPYGTNHNLDSQKDHSGQQKPQNAIFYDNAHDAHVTPENTQGTAFLNQPHVVKQIKNYEDKS